MQQVTEIKMNSPIIPDQGIGQIKLGMNSFNLRDLFSQNFRDESGSYSPDYDKGMWSNRLWTPFLGNLDLIYQDSLHITINLFNGKVSHLRVKNNHRGKVNNAVGIGDTMRGYYESAPDSLTEFNEGAFFYWINQRYGLSFFIGENLEDVPDDETFEAYLDMPVLEIEIFDDKQRTPIGAQKPTI